MLNLVLHPGHSKCGSTTIQDFLFLNRNKFNHRGAVLPDANFNLPYDEDYNINKTHTPRDYFAKFQSGELPLDLLEEKLKYLAENYQEHGVRRVVISAENLINGIFNTVTLDIHQLFEKYFDSVNVIYYVRKQDSFLISAWQQWGHKQGITLDDYIEKNALSGSMGDFLPIANKLSEVYGRDSVKVRPITSSALYEGDLLQDFCTRAIIKKEGLNFNIQNSNLGLSSALCANLNRISDVYENIHDQRIKALIHNNAHNSQALLTKKYPQTLSNALVEKLIGKYQEKNQQLAMMYFPTVDFDSSMSLVGKTSKDDLSALKLQVSQLEDVVAIQMDMILNLYGKLND